MLTDGQGRLCHSIAPSHHLVIHKDRGGRRGISDDESLALLHNRLSTTNRLGQYQYIRLVFLHLTDAIVREIYHNRKVILGQHLHLLRAMGHVSPSFVTFLHQRLDDIPFHIEDVTHELHLDQGARRIVQVFALLRLGTDIRSGKRERLHLQFLRIYAKT